MRFRAAFEEGCFFKARNVRLFLGDAVETMQQLPDESVDLIFVDPPYGLSNGGFTCQAGKRVSVNKGEWDKSRGLESNFEFHSAWLEECRRILKPNGGLWVSGTHHSIYACGFALQRGKWHILNEICWYKPNAAPHLACRMFAHSHETLIWARKTKSSRHYFDYDKMRDSSFPKDFIKQKNKQMRSVWSISTPAPWEKKYGKHPTQKPFDLLERIILATSKKGDLILDPFCGSATTGVAALMHGRGFVGIDNECKYLEDFAIPRLKDAMKRAVKHSSGANQHEQYGQQL